MLGRVKEKLFDHPGDEELIQREMKISSIAWFTYNNQRFFILSGVTARASTLRRELPTFPTGVPMNIELDGAILVQNLGR